MTVVDVNHFHPVVSEAGLRQAVAIDGIDGLIGKVSEGRGYADPTWAANRDLAIRAGVGHVGGYLFYRHTNSSMGGGTPQQNVDNFMRHLGNPDLLAIRATIDCEDDKAPVDGARHSDELHAASDLLAAELGSPTMIYTGPWWWEPHVGNHGGWATNLALWMSGYVKNRPSAPFPWNHIDLWQWTSTGSCPGVAGLCDLSAGNVNDILRGTAVSPPTYPPGEEPLSAQEVADINAHTDEATNKVIEYLSKVIQGDDPADLGLARMVASMHHGNYGETAGAAGGDLTFFDHHVLARCQEAVKPIIDHLGIPAS